MVQQGLRIIAAKKREIEYKKKISEANVFSPVDYDTVRSNFYNVYEMNEGRPFEITEFNKEIFHELCLYFSDDKRFNGRLKKGILLIGKPGSCKTSIMKALARVGNRGFRMVTAKELIHLHTDKGFGAVEPYTNEKLDMFKRPNGTLFDDFGSEPDSKHYGNVVNVMGDIIELIDKKKTWGVMHLTSNITTKDIQDKYGDRVYSRLNMMFNLMTYKSDAPDMRR